MFSRFDRIQACDGLTDRQTDEARNIHTATAYHCAVNSHDERKNLRFADDIG